jgi:outer membrane protein OmpA-like peptidoglycan-associated protein
MRPVPLPARAALLVLAAVLGGCAGAKPDLAPVAAEVRRLQAEARELADGGDAARYLERSVALSGGAEDEAGARRLHEALAAARASLAAAVRQERSAEADSARRTAANARRDWQDALRMLVQTEKVAERAARGVARTEPPEPPAEELPASPSSPDSVASPEALNDGLQQWSLAAHRMGVPVADVEGRVLDAVTASRAPKIEPEVRAHHLRLGGWALVEMAERVRSESERRAARAALERALRLTDLRDQALWAMVDLERSMKDSARNQLEDERQRLADREQSLYESLKQFEGKFASIRREARGTIMSLSDILFDFGRSNLRREAEINLAKVAVILQQYPEMKILVEGHTDNVGSEEYNLKLSEKRARSVYDFLVTQGVEPGRMATQGYGMSQPVESNATAEGRQKNRRVDLVIREES